MQMTFTKLPKSITAEELLSTPLPPVKWIVPGLLPAGLALFAGPSKAGKSWLTLWLCLQIAQGNPVWNREIEPRTVIYFSLEDTFNRLQNRIFQLIDGGDAPERLILQTECPSIGQGLEEQVESLIHTYRDVGLIVIDTLQKVRVSDGNGGMYANDYKEAGALKKLADKYGICILLMYERLPACLVMHRQVQRWIFTPTHSTRTSAMRKKNLERRLDYDEKNQADTRKQKYLTESTGTLLLSRKGTWP